MRMRQDSVGVGLLLRNANEIVGRMFWRLGSRLRCTLGAKQGWLCALLCLPTLEGQETGQSWQLVMLGEGEIEDRESRGTVART
jgi:hypothetical protein